ncbi:MAG: hypothetical protein CMO66_03730 [Verrucomicrobiales bacterium]|nr:hypothetical protein [Verrucomicrobiales bacterium]
MNDERFIDEEKSLACVHCGLCLSACPTYLETGNENDSPRGRVYLMRALQTGRLQLEDAAVRHIDLCLGCRACETACPSGVEYGHLLEHTRDHVEQHYKRSWFQTFLRRFAIEKIFPFPGRMRWALLPARLIKTLHLQWLLPRFAREAFDLVPDFRKTAPLPSLSEATETPPRGHVGFIEGCVMQVMFGETNRTSVNLLNNAGWSVHNPAGQGCCGALYAHSGQLELARECARRNIAVFEALKLDAIIINAAGCGSTLKEYDQLLAEDNDWAERAKAFSNKVKDLTEWLEETQFANNGSGEKVTYHDACHLAHPQGITTEPRILVRAVAGDRFVELPESEICCGSAGSYNLTEPEMAARLQKRKIDNILATEADVVVTSNPGCQLQIQAGLKKTGSKMRVMHIADYLLNARDE